MTERPELNAQLQPLEQQPGSDPAPQWYFEPPADCVLALPERCANCGEPGGASVRLEPPLGKRWRSVLVPHCARCVRRLAQSKTRHAVALAAALLLGLVVLLGSPLLPLQLSLFSYSALVTSGSIAPLVMGWWMGRRKARESGQTAAEVAVWWDTRGLVGTNGDWFRTLAELNRGLAQPTAGRPRWSWRTLLVPATLLAVSPTAFQWLFPTLVVLNLSPSEFELVVDGVRRGTIGVTSLESTSAGFRLPLGAGRHVLEARSQIAAVDGESVTYRAEVNVDAGDEYLFAPGADGYCFWLERTVYGRSDGRSRVQPLGGKDGFFRLPSLVDTWFAANPEPNSDRHSTGGEMVAVRHGRCADRPDAGKFGSTTAPRE